MLTNEPFNMNPVHVGINVNIFQVINGRVTNLYVSGMFYPDITHELLLCSGCEILTFGDHISETNNLLKEHTPAPMNIRFKLWLLF